MSYFSQDGLIFIIDVDLADRVTIQYNTIQYNVLYFERVDT